MSVPPVPPETTITVQPQSVYPPPPPSQLPGGGLTYEPRPADPPPSGFNGRSCLLGCGGCLALIVIAIAAILLTGAVSVNGVVNNLAGLFNVNRPSTATITSTQTVITSIQPLGQLVSVSTQLARADIYVGIESGVANACGFGANHVAQGAIDAGIDLTQLSAADVQYDALRNTYILTLPAAQLTSCRVEYIRQYERTTTACNVDWDEARFLANYTALIGFRNDAVEGGILSRAETEARDVLSNFIGLTTGAAVEINFRRADGGPVFPTSCQPDAPPGWVQNVNGTWTEP